MSLSSGARLGPYKIVAPLGAGGMGEVWTATLPRAGNSRLILVIHSDNDRSVPVQQAIDAAEALQKANVPNRFVQGPWTHGDYRRGNPGDAFLHR